MEIQGTREQQDYPNSAEDCTTCTRSNCPAKGRLPSEKKLGYLQRQTLLRRMCRIKEKIVVLSGKGGVGKSTVAAGVAIALSRRGKETGLLDTDIHGPSIPSLLGLQGSLVCPDEEGMAPVLFDKRLKVMSIGFMLELQDAPIIWRGPMKADAIRQFLRDVAWGDLDYLVVDSPPGTGDEPLSTCQMLGDPKSAIIVTTPQEIALIDVRKSITFCRKLDIPVLGVIENMSGFVCPHCSKVTNIFSRGGAEHMALEMDVPFLGRIPLDPAVVAACDQGGTASYLDSNQDTANAFRQVVDHILRRREDEDDAIAPATSQPLTCKALGRKPEAGPTQGDAHPTNFSNSVFRSGLLDVRQSKTNNPFSRIEELSATAIGYCGLVCGICIHDCQPSCRGGGGSEDCYQRACCISKGLEGCWECDGFPCNEGAFAETNALSRGICVSSTQCIKENGKEQCLRLIAASHSIPLDYAEFQEMEPALVTQELFTE